MEKLVEHLKKKNGTGPDADKVLAKQLSQPDGSGMTALHYAIFMASVRPTGPTGRASGRASAHSIAPMLCIQT